jgi:response regulator of citrate/malate metabolism
MSFVRAIEIFGVVNFLSHCAKIREMQNPSRPFSVLIVEDVDEMRGLLEYVLQGIPEISLSGAAKNGFEARLELSRRKPTLVLLDEVLPGESSLDLLNEFKSNEVKVVLMTSLENPSKVLPAGVIGRMAKPGWKSIEEDRLRIQRFLFQPAK